MRNIIYDDEYFEQYEKVKAMLLLAEIDPGMKDLLDQAKEYYILKGEPEAMSLLEKKLAEKAKELQILERLIMEERSRDVAC